MRLSCPLCGERDLREFHYRGDAVLMSRPEGGDAEAMHRYLHIRANPAGEHSELWSHALGCRAWLVVRRDTTSHEVLSVQLARDAEREGTG